MALAVIWVIVLVYVFYPAGRVDTSSEYEGELQRRRSVREDRSRALGLDLPRVELELLDIERPKYKGVVKDIFSPVKPAPPKVKPKPVVLPKHEPVEVEPPAPPPVEDFISHLSFAGFLEKGVRTTVFISTKDEIFLVQGGDVLSSRFKVVEIKTEYITFMDTVTREVGTLTFGE